MSSVSTVCRKRECDNRGVRGNKQKETKMKKGVQVEVNKITKTMNDR